MLVCRICKNTANNRIHPAREMMFGTRDKFNYLECGECGTVQIADVPDLAPYYPANYLSFDSNVPVAATLRRRIGARIAGRYLVSGKGVLGKFVAGKRPTLVELYPSYLRNYPLGIDLDSRILDLGCGVGNLLQTLHYYGFRNLTGADAFIEEDIFYPSGVRIYKRRLDEIETSFDLIMLHHSFEHFPDPIESLRQIHRLMEKDSFLLIRIPLINYAWEKYGVNWVQLDAPRHLFLFTEKSFRYLADQANLKVENVTYDSNAFQFWGSEQYVRNIPLSDPESLWNNPGSKLFAAGQMDEWQDEAEKLNARGKGDMACFYLRKV
ncbi:MAG: class I SAM-dependent methyltransferase [Saprospiraceae bacterium]|nr:class I SAM-dependent methyltransferase [Pyrinomonadaceae bacterium]